MRPLLTLRRVVSAATVMAMTITGLPVIAATRAPSPGCKAMAQMGHECHRPSASLTCCCSGDDSQSSSVPAERSGSLASIPSSDGVRVAVTMPPVHDDPLAPAPTQGYRNRDLPTLFATFLL